MGWTSPCGDGRGWTLGRGGRDPPPIVAWRGWTPCYRAPGVGPAGLDPRCWEDGGWAPAVGSAAGCWGGGGRDEAAPPKRGRLPGEVGGISSSSARGGGFASHPNFGWASGDGCLSLCRRWCVSPRDAAISAPLLHRRNPFPHLKLSMNSRASLPFCQRDVDR